jgi:hypothetical protein
MADGDPRRQEPDDWYCCELCEKVGQQLRETLRKKTKPDLIEKCKAAGISRYSNKKKEELIDLLVRKTLRPDEQVYYAGALDASGLLVFALCALRIVPCGTCSVASLRPSYPASSPLLLSIAWLSASVLVGVTVMNPTGRLDKR